jgi:hypothetical protein
MNRDLSPQLAELLDALSKLRAGRRCDIDVIRLLELYERFHDARQDYWAVMAAAIAVQAIRPDR